MLLNAFIWSLTLLSGFYAVKHWLNVKSSAHLLFPFFLFGLIVALCISVALTQLGISLRENVVVLMDNLWQLIRAWILAVVGMALFKAAGRNEVVKGWKGIVSKEAFFFLCLITVGHLFWTWFVFSSWDKDIIRSATDYRPAIVVLSGGLFGATIEELIFRLCLLSFLVHWLPKNTSSWIWGIVFSAIVWALIHLQNTDAGFFKVVQMIPLGFALGYSMLKYCFEVSITLHLLTNVVLWSIEFRNIW